MAAGHQVMSVGEVKVDVDHLTRLVAAADIPGYESYSTFDVGLATRVNKIYGNLIKHKPKEIESQIGIRFLFDDALTQVIKAVLVNANADSKIFDQLVGVAENYFLKIVPLIKTLLHIVTTQKRSLNGNESEDPLVICINSLKNQIRRMIDNWTLVSDIKINALKANLDLVSLVVSNHSKDQYDIYIRCLNKFANHFAKHFALKHQSYNKFSEFLRTVSGLRGEGIIEDTYTLMVESWLNKVTLPSTFDADAFIPRLFDFFYSDFLEYSKLRDEATRTGVMGSSVRIKKVKDSFTKRLAAVERIACACGNADYFPEELLDHLFKKQEAGEVKEGQAAEVKESQAMQQFELDTFSRVLFDKDYDFQNGQYKNPFQYILRMSDDDLRLQALMLKLKDMYQMYSSAERCPQGEVYRYKLRSYLDNYLLDDSYREGAQQLAECHMILDKWGSGNQLELEMKNDLFLEIAEELLANNEISADTFEVVRCVDKIKALRLNPSPSNAMQHELEKLNRLAKKDFAHLGSPRARLFGAIFAWILAPVAITFGLVMLFLAPQATSAMMATAAKWLMVSGSLAEVGGLISRYCFGRSQLAHHLLMWSQPDPQNRRHPIVQDMRKALCLA